MPHKHTWSYVGGCSGHEDDEYCYCDSAHFQCSGWFELITKGKSHKYKCVERLSTGEVETILNAS